MLARMTTSEAARRLSALGASKGGVARAKKLSAAERQRIARAAALARWAGPRVARKVRAEAEGCLRCAGRRDAVEAVFAAHVAEVRDPGLLSRAQIGKLKAMVLAAL